MAFRGFLMLVLSAWALSAWAPDECPAQPAPADAAPAPFAVLYDTSAASPAVLAGDALAAKKGWTTVPEDTLAHQFTGDTVFMNDRAAVVLRAGSAGADFYSRSTGGWSRRAALVPLAADGAAGALSSVKIVENSQAAVMIEATLKTSAGAAASLRFRLSAGEALLDVRGGSGSGRLRICDRANYLVVPDFFADDVVFDPSRHEENRIGLPAENSVLGLSDEGKAIVACIWPSTRQNADLLLSGEEAARKIAGYEIDLPENSRLWIAVMEGEGIWHARRVTEKNPPEFALEWKPPMPARWRCDVVAGGGASVSCSFANGETGAASDDLRSEQHSSDKPGAGCRFDAGRALVRMNDSAGTGPAGLVVIYPIERTRTTPLTAFCLVDIMRNALGVGPCQYVLDTEKLGAGDNPTPAHVTRWVESQFEKKPSKRDRDEIRDQLNKMVQQVKRTDARISEYAAFCQKVKQACDNPANGAENAAAAARLGTIAQAMAAPPAGVAASVEKLAADVAAQADQKNATAKAAASIAAIRAAGAEQDYALARLRMAARRLKQEARTLAATDAKSAALAGEIQQLAEQMLFKK